MIVASAPGKVVVTGEYAVLAGAPALVTAVNRRVSCTLETAQSDVWRIDSRNLAGASTHRLDTLLSSSAIEPADPAWMCHHLLAELRARDVPLEAFPHALDIVIDSTACYHAGQKLGIGSSAAVAVALTSAVLCLLEECPTKGRCDAQSDPSVGHLRDLEVMLATHARAQGGRGSGLDVAASHQGGLIRFRRSHASRAEGVALPRGVECRFVSTGTATSTPKQLAGFDSWRGGGVPPTLAALCSAAERVADALSEPAAFMRELRGYVSCLEDMDRTAGLGIFPASQRTLLRLASDAGVVYKPCGAGGGDVGMAFALDTAPLDLFARQAQAAGFVPLPMELSQHGVEVRAQH